MILVTGGAGFIGSNFVIDWLADCDEPVLNLDLLSYAGNPDNLAELAGDPRHVFVRGDIADADLLAKLLAQYRPRAIVNFAAETHVDRSIERPEAFVQTNVVGTLRLLEAAYVFWRELPAGEQAGFRFLQISTDEVFGSLADRAPPFVESDAYAPNSPYAASKAAADHLVRAYHRTYGLPVLTSHCSNNYGPRQFPEKLIPLVIQRALVGQSLPIYGDGRQIRDWLYVGDHCRALRRILEVGRVGEAYNVGGGNELTNLALVDSLCALLDELQPRADGLSYRQQIAFVEDRPGHDRRYAIDAGKLERELGWTPGEIYTTGIRKTVRWYLENRERLA